MKIKLKDIAHRRSGDKGDAANIEVVAKVYPELVSGT